jgi:hypothetical protein
MPGLEQVEGISSGATRKDRMVEGPSWRYLSYSRSRYSDWRKVSEVIRHLAGDDPDLRIYGSLGENDRFRRSIGRWEWSMLVGNARENRPEGVPLKEWYRLIDEVEECEVTVETVESGKDELERYIGLLVAEPRTVIFHGNAGGNMGSMVCYNAED